MKPRYLVQTRRVGEPWLTVERYETESAAVDGAYRKNASRSVLQWLMGAPRIDHVRVIHKGREVFNPRRAA
jgi:hypothetical protein